GAGEDLGAGGATNTGRCGCDRSGRWSVPGGLRGRGLGCHRFLSFLVVLLVFRSEEHTSELQSRFDLVCRLLLEKNYKLATTLAISASSLLSFPICSALRVLHSFPTPRSSDLGAGEDLGAGGATNTGRCGCDRSGRWSVPGGLRGRGLGCHRFLSFLVVLLVF